MTDRPDISVIVPHLNQPDALAVLLDHLDRQDFDGVFEVIVADNGSRAPLPEAIVSRRRTRIVVELQPGPGPARNAGAAVARGPILAFSDCDCLPNTGWLAAIDRHFHSPDAAPAVAGRVEVAFASPDRPTALEAYEAIFGYRQDLYVRRDGFAATCNFAVLAEVFARVGPFAGLDTAEDRDWGRRATQLGIRHAFLPDAVVRTPARASFAELARKWDRHIGHDFADRRGSWRWLARAAAIAVSPAWEIFRVVSSPRVSGMRSRIMAFGILVRIRLHRARQMVALMGRVSPDALTEGWRR